MNERLRQFERESKLEIFGLGARRDKWEAALEKYAELIVRECCDIVHSKTDESIRVVMAIEQHFGVE